MAEHYLKHHFWMAMSFILAAFVSVAALGQSGSYQHAAWVGCSFIAAWVMGRLCQIHASRSQDEQQTVVAWEYQDDANVRHPGSGTRCVSTTRQPHLANECELVRRRSKEGR